MQSFTAFRTVKAHRITDSHDAFHIAFVGIFRSAADFTHVSAHAFLSFGSQSAVVVHGNEQIEFDG